MAQRYDSVRSSHETRFLLSRSASRPCSPWPGSDLPRQEPTEPDQPAADTRLPNGKSQQEEILKAEREKSLKDAAALIELAEQLKADLEKNDRHVLSIATLKKTEGSKSLPREFVRACIISVLGCALAGAAQAPVQPRSPLLVVPNGDPKQWQPIAKDLGWQWQCRRRITLASIKACRNSSSSVNTAIANPAVDS